MINLNRMQVMILACFFGASFVDGSTATVLKAAETKARFLLRANPGRIKIEGATKSDDPSSVLVDAVLEGDKLKINSTVALDKLDTGIELRNKHMKENYLETAKFPKAEFKMEPLNISEKNPTDFKGTLTVHGKNLPVLGKADVKSSEKELSVSLQSVVKMTDFGILQPHFMGIKVEDEVNLELVFRGLK